MHPSPLSQVGIVTVYRSPMVIYVLKGTVHRFNRGVHGTVSSSGRFYGVTDRSHRAVADHGFYMVAHFTMRTYGVNQAFRLVEGIWLHRNSRQIRFLLGKH